MAPPNEQDAAYQVTKAITDSALEPIKDVLHNVIGPASIEIGQLFGDYAKTFRLQQTVKMMEKVRRICERAGIPVHPVSPAVLLPAFNYASLEADDSMQQRWAALIANAATAEFETEVPPGFPEVLHQLTPAEARFLDRCFDQLSRVQGYDRPPDVLLLGTLEALIHLVTDEYFTSDQIHTKKGYDSFQMMVENAVRLGLFVRFDKDTVFTRELKHADDEFALTLFGWHFIRACRGRGENKE